MIYKLDRGCHSVFALQYHFVQCVKYRKKALVSDGVIDLLKQKIREISETFKVEVLNVECDKDHFHLLFKGKPTLDIPKYINTMKTISSREIQRRFPEVKKLLWKEAFWSSEMTHENKGFKGIFVLIIRGFVNVRFITL